MAHYLIMNHYEIFIPIAQILSVIVHAFAVFLIFFPTLKRLPFKIKIHKPQYRCEFSHIKLLHSP